MAVQLLDAILVKAKMKLYTIVEMDDGFLEENHLLDGFGVDVFDASTGTPIDFLSHGVDEEGGTTDTATTENSARHDKDSGVGRTDESCKNDESSEQELMEGECGSPESNSANRPLGSDHLHLSNESFTSNEHVEHPDNMATNDISAEECDKFRADLETRCSRVDTDLPQHQRTNGNNNGNGPISRKDSQSSIEREIIQLNKEMEMIQMECQEIVEAHSHRQSRDLKAQPAAVSHLVEAAGRHEPFRNPRMVPRMGTRLDCMKQMLAAQEASQGQQMYAQQALGMMGSDMQPLWMRHNDQHLNTNHIAKDLSLKPKEVQQLVSASHSAAGSGEDKDKDKDTSNTSAYNTGDSCRSTPLTLELSSAPAMNGHKGSLLSLSVNQQPPIKPSYSDSEKMTQTGATNGIPMNIAAQSQTCKQMRDWSSDGSESKKLRQYLPQHRVQSQQPGNLSKSVSNGSFSENKTSQTPNGDLSQTENADSLQELYAQYADVMYTNRANLEHTIMVQQKLFQQQLMQRSAHARLQDNCTQEGATGMSQSDMPSTSGLPQSPSASSHMEWVVKRRADGSRYITRRPVRNRILKERAKKIQEERCGMTTDDDAVSEMKVGRYWTKDERKKHLEKVREHKRRKQEMLKSRMETVKENEEEKKKEPNIVELSHRKMMKHKNKRVFDDFTTVQEMMAHGSREPTNPKGYNPLLSVTTV